MILDDTVWTYLDEHEKDDVRRFALHAKLPWAVAGGDAADQEDAVQSYPNLTWVLQQISGRQTAEHKLPAWAHTPHLLYPPRVPMEQCSSQEAADYKAQIVRELATELTSEFLGEPTNETTNEPVDEPSQPFTFADLTGGFGVDCAAIAAHASHAFYVEQNPELTAIVRHNYEQLGLAHTVEIHNTDAREFLAIMPAVDVIMLDPARRDSHGNRTYALQDCEPNVLNLVDTLAQKGHFVLLKLSPMLDWHKTVADLAPFTRDVHIVSVKGECKELLLVLDMHRTSSDYQRAHFERLLCVDLPEVRYDAHAQGQMEIHEGRSEGESHVHHGASSQTQPSSPCIFVVRDGAAVNAPAQVMKQGENLEGKVLWEPNASVMKAGCFAAFSQAFGVEAIGENSHLFIGNTPEIITTIPAKGFEIEKVSGLGKRELKELTAGLTHANIAVRNAPFTPATLSKKLKLKDGSDITIFATTNAAGEHVLIRAKRIS